MIIYSQISSKRNYFTKILLLKKITVPWVELKRQNKAKDKRKNSQTVGVRKF